MKPPLCYEIIYQLHAFFIVGDLSNNNYKFYYSYKRIKRKIPTTIICGVVCVIAIIVAIILFFILF